MSDEATSPVPGWVFGNSVPSVPEATDIDVDPDKVHDVARVLEDQANALGKRLGAELEALRIEPPAQDIVSTHAAHAWNSVIADGEESYEARVRAYIAGLHDLAGQLRAAGERYQADEQARADTLGAFGGK